METRFTRARNEQGMALIGVILLLMLASGICAALAVSGRTETMAAYNVDTSVQAREAAQAGLTAGIEAVLTYLNDNSGSISSLLSGPNVAITTDDGSLAAYGLPAPGATAQLGSLSGIRYSVRVMDEEDTERGITWTSAMLTRIGENGSTTSDANDKIVIRATGTGRNSTSTTLESILYMPKFPGIVTEGDLLISGSVSVEGDEGGVHSNSDLSFNGSPDVEQDATCTGTLDLSNADVGGTAAGGRARLEIPNFHAADYLSQANWRLMSDGKVYNSSGTQVCDASVVASNCSATYGFTKTGSGWDPSGSTNGVYYIQGDISFDHVTLTGTTLISTGSIHIGANGRITSGATTVAALTGLLMEMDGDLEMTGNSDAMGGAILIRGQFNFGGNHSIGGQVIARGETDVNVVTDNNVHGNSTFTYDGGGYQVKTYTVGSWREVK